MMERELVPSFSRDPLQLPVVGSTLTLLLCPATQTTQTLQTGESTGSQATWATGFG